MFKLSLYIISVCFNTGSLLDSEIKPRPRPNVTGNGKIRVTESQSESTVPVQCLLASSVTPSVEIISMH